MPPTNIPPPSILLSIFPELFSKANQSLYQPVSGQSFSIKKRILSDPKTIEFLKGYLVLTTVTARVIAGRRLRWHRDKFLSQRMSISTAGSKGMKLASVDKAETAREDREATDVVAAWNEQVGRLRSAVAAANSSLKTSADHLKIPDIKETMQVQTAKVVPTAPKACLICGLKRDERIAKVDYEVEDSFGEWWADHWGHASCKRFWLQHETALRQR
ncbi:putative serine threonine-protein kinase ppk6 protein [Eutypa lata UCREL1]|uniref:Putative serine threonine-protein kinase ppk6 protein n=1 Tax=Eutypa lata (strain UCR-EL1) TaxID=1287681 RepID=M7SGK4_EUTLA|nr:putative serine threonine-protein kinase ppk6 protein [Eutypa lata UCREL1]